MTIEEMSAKLARKILSYVAEDLKNASPETAVLIDLRTSAELNKAGFATLANIGRTLDFDEETRLSLIDYLEDSLIEMYKNLDKFKKGESGHEEWK
jgi:hypothetical protein